MTTTAGSAHPEPTASARSVAGSTLAIAAVAVVAGIVGALSGAHPTGATAIDAVWCFVFAAGVTVAAVQARPWTWVLLAAVAALAAGGATVAVACALVGLVLAVVGTAWRVAPAVLGPLAVGLAAQALLRLPDLGFFGLPSLAALVAVAPLLVSAFVASGASTRRRVRRTALIGGGLLLVALAGFGVAAVTARSPLQAGVDSSRDGVAAVRVGDQQATTTAFSDATTSFESAHQSLAAPWALPVRLVPGIAQQSRALTDAASIGADLAETASSAAAEANYRDLRASKGTIDLAAVVAMQEPVARSAAALHDAQDRLALLDSGWLLPPISSPLASLSDDLDQQVTDADLASEALAVAPGLLGGSELRRYVVLFTNPAEARFQGGFVAAFAELTVQDGTVTLGETTTEREFQDSVGAQERTLDVAPDLLERYRRYDPSRFLQNLTVSPDVPTDAELVRSIYPQLTGTPIDGVIIADPFALAAFLELTGPVAVEGLDIELSADNAVEHLLKGQYVTEQANSERKERLGDAAGATFDALTSRDLPGPGRLGEVLGPVVRDGHLQFVTFDDAETAFLDQLGTIRRFDPRVGADYVSLRTANANPNKLDPYLQRRLDYDVTYEPTTGTARSVATVTLTNTAPLTGLTPYVASNAQGEPDASNTMYLSLYSPLDLREVTFDGAPFGIEPQREFGGRVYSALVTVPAGETRTLRFDLEGTLTTGADYELDVLSQPMINADGMRVQVRTDDPDARIAATEGLTVVGEIAAIDTTITENRRFAVNFVAR